jgi:hypothetical protein
VLTDVCEAEGLYHMPIRLGIPRGVEEALRFTFQALLLLKIAGNNSRRNFKVVCTFPRNGTNKLPEAIGTIKLPERQIDDSSYTEIGEVLGSVWLGGRDSNPIGVSCFLPFLSRLITASVTHKMSLSLGWRLLLTSYQSVHNNGRRFLHTFTALLITTIVIEAN